MAKKKKNAPQFRQGFTQVDEVFMNLVGSLFQTKVQQIMTNQDLIHARKEVITTVEVASQITTNRTYADLITTIQKYTPQYFGFDAVGIMFRDIKNGLMFTISAKLNEKEQEEADEYYEKVRSGQPITNEDRVAEFERQHKQRQQDYYSSMTGLTGTVFTTGQLMWANDMK